MARPHITELRKLRKLSQAGLAKVVGLTSAEISRIECGYRDLAETEAVAIAGALGVVPGKIDERLLKPVAPVGMAASTGASRTSGIVPPSGSLEEDPANFREMPDMTVLERGSLDEADFRKCLTDVLKRANQVLHTSRVPAAVWREWRQFERVVAERLRR